MKQLIILLMVFILPLSVSGQEFIISGEVTGNAEGQSVTLRQFASMQPVDIVTTTVSGGKFTLRGSVSHPEFTQLIVGNKEPYNFFVESGNIHVMIDLDELSRSKVTGSKENDLFMEFLVGLEVFSHRQRQLNETAIALSTSGELTPEAMMSLRAQAEAVNNEQTTFIVNFVRTNPGRVASAFLTFNFLMQVLDISHLEQIANGFEDKEEPSQWVAMLKTYVTAVTQTAVGKRFLDITLKTPDDRPISLSDHAGKGKYVLVDFWAAWCGPCRVANPHLVQIYNQYKDKGFEIVGISLDDSREAWLQAIADDRLTWPQMSDLKRWQSEASRLYNVSGIPHMILLDRDGTIMARGISVGALAAKLAEIFD